MVCTFWIFLKKGIPKEKSLAPWNVNGKAYQKHNLFNLSARESLQVLE